MSTKNNVLKLLVAKDVAVSATGVTTSNATDGAVVSVNIGCNCPST